LLEKFPDLIKAKLNLSKYPDIKYDIVLEKQIDNKIYKEKINNASILILINDGETDSIIESRGVLVWNKKDVRNV